jgi:thiamine pyrophosphokinase
MNNILKNGKNNFNYLMSSPRVIDTSFCYRRDVPGSGSPVALVLLNCEGPLDTSFSPFLRALWHTASLRLCADGAASRLYHSLVAGASAPPSSAGASAPTSSSPPPSAAAAAALQAYLPDAIVGDWDSIDSAAEAYYRAAGVPLHPAPEDQDSTDLEKCLAHLLARAAPLGGAGLRVVIAGSFGGRLDHTVQNLNCLYKWSPAFEALAMVTQHSAAVLLPAGASSVRVAWPYEGPTCALLPLGGPSQLTTHGLQWDLAGTPSQFGGMVSTSNCVLGWGQGVAPIPVAASQPVIWTINVNAAAVGGGQQEQAEA